MPATLLHRLAALTAAFATPPQADVVVQGSAAGPAIRRILEADNLDVDRLPAGEVAARMSLIPRGAAPAEFWTAYQAHVQAWSDYAKAKKRARLADPLDTGQGVDGRAIASARRRINATFDVVEALAKRHGAWPPRVPTRF